MPYFHSLLPGIQDPPANPLLAHLRLKQTRSFRRRPGRRGGRGWFISLWATFEKPLEETILVLGELPRRGRRSEVLLVSFWVTARRRTCWMLVHTLGDRRRQPGDIQRQRNVQKCDLQALVRRFPYLTFSAVGMLWDRRERRVSSSLCLHISFVVTFIHRNGEKSGKTWTLISRFFRSGEGWGKEKNEKIMCTTACSCLFFLLSVFVLPSFHPFTFPSFCHKN